MPSFISLKVFFRFSFYICSLPLNLFILFYVCCLKITPYVSSTTDWVEFIYANRMLSCYNSLPLFSNIRLQLWVFIYYNVIAVTFHHPTTLLASLFLFTSCSYSIINLLRVNWLFIFLWISKFLVFYEFLAFGYILF